MMKHVKLLLLSAVLVNLAHAPSELEAKIRETNAALASPAAAPVAAFFENLEIVSKLPATAGATPITKNDIEALVMTFEGAHERGRPMHAILFLKEHGYATQKAVDEVKNRQTVAGKWLGVSEAMTRHLFIDNPEATAIANKFFSTVYSATQDCACRASLTEFLFVVGNQQGGQPNGKKLPAEIINYTTRLAAKQTAGHETYKKLSSNEVVQLLFDLNALPKQTMDTARLIMLCETYLNARSVETKKEVSRLRTVGWFAAIAISTMAWNAVFGSIIFGAFEHTNLTAWDFFTKTLPGCGEYVCPAHYGLTS